MVTPARLSRLASPILIALAALLAALPCATGAQSLQPGAQTLPPIVVPDDRIRVIQTDPTLKQDIASIQVYCKVQGARLAIDQVDVGWLPYASDLATGSHYLEVSIPGYYSLGAQFIFQEKTLYTINSPPRGSSDPSTSKSSPKTPP